MKFILATGIIAIVAYIAQLFLPWWIIALIAFIIGAILSTGALQAFFSGFTGIFLLWIIHAIVLESASGAGFADKVSDLFMLPASFLIFLVTALVGGLVGGMGALSGYYLKSALNFPQKQKI